ncbi:MAG: phosphate ABC transporter, permease protein PstA, partial [candidate division WOR-3 bacterium]
GETAPILFTGVAYFTRHLPRTPFEKFMALPYHLFALSTQHDQLMKVRPLAYGTAIVLLLAVLTFDALAFVIRFRTTAANRWQV